MARRFDDVLLVDDEDELLYVVGRAMMSATDPLPTVRSLFDARRAIGARCPDVLVVASWLPDGDPLVLVREVHRIKPWARILVLHKGDSTEHLSALVAAGATAIIPKPFDVGSLPARLDRLRDDARDEQRQHARQQELELRLHHADRVALLGTLCASVAHEIANPLAVILANAHYLRTRGLTGAPAVPGGRTPADAIAEIEASGSVINQIIRGLRGFSRRADQVPTLAPLSGVVEMMTVLLGPKLRTGGVEVQTPASPGPMARHVPVRLAQALVNTVSNAMDATPSGHVRVDYVDEPEFVGFVVDDDGPGLAAEERERVMEPFYTTKPEGTGLGMGVMRDVMAEHDGKLELGERPGGRGLRVRLLVPRAQR